MAPPALHDVAAPKAADPLAGLGLGGLVAGDDKELTSQLLALQASLADLKVGAKKSSKDRKKDRGRKKSRSRSSDRKKKKGKKKKSGSSRRSSRKSSSSSRKSRRSSSSSSGSSESRFIRFRPGKEGTKFDSRMMERHRGLRFKRRSDLLNFAAKHPGALAGHFLAQVRERLSRGEPRTGKELLETDVSSWVPLSGLKEVRDVREASVLCRILTELTHRRTEKAADLIAMRLRELRYAKATGSSWEKAEVCSLLPGSVAGTAPVPEAAMALQ